MKTFKETIQNGIYNELINEAWYSEFEEFLLIWDPNGNKYGLMPIKWGIKLNKQYKLIGPEKKATKLLSKIGVKDKDLSGKKAEDIPTMLKKAQKFGKANLVLK